MKRTVSDFLERSGAAAACARLDLGQGRGIAVWENCNDRVRYETPQNHTFSLYLRGGAGTSRVDAGGARGYPGAVCIMPEGCGSEWEITDRFRFVHLYLSDTELRSAYARTHDCDARRLDLHEETFAGNTSLIRPLAQLAAAAEVRDILFAESALAEFFGALRARPADLRGGLAAHLLRRIDDWIEAHLEEVIRLEDLASIAGLSEFHFHRMFKQSRGVAPHGWVLERRTARARELLAGSMPLSQIAAACGFSSQSHMTRVFRSRAGHSPAAYRKLLRAG